MERPASEGKKSPITLNEADLFIAVDKTRKFKIRIINSIRSQE